MEIRAVEGETITVPAEDGQSVHLSMQNQRLVGVGMAGSAQFDLERLHFGNRRELEGEVWRAKQRIRLVVERAHGN